MAGVSAEVHYGGRVYALANPEGAGDLRVKAMALLKTGGGVLDFDSDDGAVTITISSSVPLAIVSLDEKDTHIYAF